MIDLKRFHLALTKKGVQFVSGVPDTLLNDFCLYLEDNWPLDKHILAANEGNAIALAAGYHLISNTIPLVYMQNSGIGNAMNPLISLTHPSVYGIPMILLIGWRGEPNVNDHPQHTKQGQLTPVLMDDIDIPWIRLSDSIDEVENAIDWAISRAKEISGPVALLVPKGVLERGEKSGFDDEPDLMSREEAIGVLVDTLPKDTIFVAATGRATRELYEVRRIRGESHANDFLNVGAMGHTSSIAAGIALAKKERLVVCLDGDASCLMHLGALGVNGQTQYSNLLHIVLNNGVHESVGGQRSVTGNFSLAAVAGLLGYDIADSKLFEKSKLVSILTRFKKQCVLKCPSIIEIKIRKGIRTDLPVLKFDLKKSKINFQQANIQ